MKMRLTIVVGLFLMTYGHTGLADEDPHAAHRQAMANKGQATGNHAYQLEDLEATDKSGKRLELLDAMPNDRAVMLNFIFTSCTTICPVMTATFAHVQHMLGDEAADVTMVSVSIDPEYDTPKRLARYAEQFRAGPQWRFLTGSHEEMIAIQRAFDAYSGSKMSHQPLTFIRGAGREDWLRINGMAGAAQIISEYRKLDDSPQE